MIKMSKKGFTLVELLAVIVILAIIAVIAVPSVLKIISGAREDAFKASVRSAIKEVELEVTQDTTGTKTSGYLTGLNIDNNPFKGGTWEYDKTTKKVIIYEARDNASITSSNYVITADKEQINSDKFTVGKPKDTNPKLLANKLKDGTALGDGTYDSGTGYIKGTTPKNHVCTNSNGDSDCDDTGEILWRVVRLFDDKSVLMVTQSSVDTKSYDNDFNLDDNTCTGECSNNFANADIKTYLNKDFYNTITNKHLLKYNEWNTTNDLGTTNTPGDPSSIIAKVGLLTIHDYNVVSNNGTDTINYLNNETYWWLGTGHSSIAGFAWNVYVDGCAYDGDVGISIGARAAVVLNSGITVTGTGDGSSVSPYTIE